MHQTAKEFMSRKYVWDQIFLNCVGFVDKSNLNLAILGGLVRRLKCCGEAAFKSSGVKDLEIFNDQPGLNDNVPDPFGILDTPVRGCELLNSAIDCANGLSETCDRFEHYVGLLDELDSACSQLTRDWKDGLPESFQAPISQMQTGLNSFSRQGAQRKI